MRSTFTADSAPSARAARARPLGLWLLAFVAFSSVLSLYALRGAVKDSPLTLPFERQLNPVLWLPEGWKFFTRDPGEARLELYVRDANGWRDAALGPNARPSNKFGLDRIGRAQGVELGLLTDAVSPRSWQPCQSASAFTCLDQAPAARQLTNHSPNPSLCGEVGLVSRKPMPWAWATRGFRVEMPASFVRLEVQC